MGVSCRARGVVGPGEGVFSLSEAAYEVAIPGDGRVGGRRLSQAVDELIPRDACMRTDVVEVDGVRASGLKQFWNVVSGVN